MTTSPHSQYHNPNSRFQVRDVPVLSPAKCLVCGSPHRAVVDTLIDLEVNGFNFRVYLCVLCIKDAATQVEGYLQARGDIESGAMTVERILAENNLKVITDEQYELLSRWYADGASLVDLPHLNPAVVSQEVSPGLAGYSPAPDPDIQPDNLLTLDGDIELDFGKSKAASK